MDSFLDSANIYDQCIGRYNRSPAMPPYQDDSRSPPNFVKEAGYDDSKADFVVHEMEQWARSDEIIAIPICPKSSAYGAFVYIRSILDIPSAIRMMLAQHDVGADGESVSILG